MHRLVLLVVCYSTNVTFLLVHGFRQSVYNVNEGNRLDTQFALNVVGITQLVAFVISGTITAAADGTASEKPVLFF